MSKGPATCFSVHVAPPSREERNHTSVQIAPSPRESCRRSSKTTPTVPSAATATVGRKAPVSSLTVIGALHERPPSEERDMRTDPPITSGHTT